MTTDPNETTPLPAQPEYEPPAPPAGQVPAAQPAPPHHAAPAHAVAAPLTGTAEPRIKFGRYAGGALAAILVCALIAWVLHYVLTDLIGLTVLSPPDVLGTSDGSTSGQRGAYALDAALITVVAAIVLALLALGAPRPRLFFGWLVVLLLIVAVTLPFTRVAEPGDAVATAVLHLVVIAAIWSLLGGVAGRAIRPGAA